MKTSLALKNQLRDDRRTAWVRRCLNLFFLGMLFATGVVSHGETAVEAWVRRYSFEGIGAKDSASKVVTDVAGNVIVAGYTDDGFNSSPDMVIIKYSAAGASVWTNLYNGPVNAEDSVADMALDLSGNVIVTGPSLGQFTGVDFATIKYSAAGVPLWTNRYTVSGLNSENPSAIAVDASGNIFVTGASGAGNNEYATVAYSGAGGPLWTNRYNGPGNDVATAIAVDAVGNVFVTGYSASTNTFPPDYAFVTIKYSGSGVPLWTNRYNGPGNANDLPNAIAVDASGNVFVTGASTPNGGSSDYVTIKYSGAGLPLWTNRYDGPGHGPDQTQGKACLVIGPDGAVYVTGASDGVYGSAETGFDYATVKYVTVPVLAIQPPVGGSSDVHLMLSGTPNSVWTVERATAFPGPWTNLGPVTIPTNGSAPFQDPTPPKSAAFYRARQ